MLFRRRREYNSVVEIVCRQSRHEKCSSTRCSFYWRRGAKRIWVLFLLQQSTGVVNYAELVSDHA